MRSMIDDELDKVFYACDCLACTWLTQAMHLHEHLQDGLMIESLYKHQHEQRKRSLAGR